MFILVLKLYIIKFVFKISEKRCLTSKKNLEKSLNFEEKKMGKNLLIAQSGGPTTVINASLAGAIKAALESNEIEKIYGSLNGLEGVLKDRIIDAGKYFKTDADFERLIKTPSMALGSCRYKLSKTPDEKYEKIVDTIKKLDIGYFMYIGGNDSMDTVDKLGQYFENQGLDVKCIGIPKTIDNDLAITDHTPGFGSAARYIAHSIAEVHCDASVYDTPTVTIIEIMGRNAGWLTAASILAKRSNCDAPHLIYLPEIPFSYDKFLKDVEDLSKQCKTIVIACSEGIKFESGDYVSAAQNSSFDAFGHAVLSGTGKFLESIVKEKFGFKTRAIELSLLQRAAAHMQSEVDVEEAFNCGQKAVEFALAGMSKKMVCMRRVSNSPYTIEYYPEDVNKIANAEKKVPREWINEAGNFVTDEMREYIGPLVSKSEKWYGMPEYFYFDKDESVMDK